MFKIAFVVVAVLGITGHFTAAMVVVGATVFLWALRFRSAKSRAETFEFSRAAKDLGVFDPLSSGELQRMQAMWFDGPRQAGISAKDFIKGVLIETGHPLGAVVVERRAPGVSAEHETVAVSGSRGTLTVHIERHHTGFIEARLPASVDLTDEEAEEYVVLGRRGLARRQYEAGSRPWEPGWLPDTQHEEVLRRFG